MAGVECLPKAWWGTVSKVFPLVLDATVQAAELCAVDLGYPTPLMVSIALALINNCPCTHKAASLLSGLSSGAWLG